jgi:two-component system, NtrC family, response regulator AtoC
MGKLLPTEGGTESVSALLHNDALPFLEGESPNMRPVEAVIHELAKNDLPVLLLAEPGAGKQATANRIHVLSSRKEQPFRSLLCSTLKPEDLGFLESKGRAEQGTVYLQEVADLSAACQALLQQAWPQKKTNGSTGEAAMRLIFGSARDLEAEVKAQRLREDLYYRISGVCLRLPPLRQRKEDIPILTALFLRKYAREFNREIPCLSAETYRLFQEYSWPGNLKELEYAASVLVALGDEDVAMGGLRALLRRPSNGDDSKMSLKEASRAASQEAEKHLILETLSRTRWNRRRAARELQISYKALLYKLKRIQCEGYGVS